MDTPPPNLFLEIEDEPASIVAALQQGLHRFNQEHLGPYDHIPLAVTYRDPDGAVVGGALGGVHLGWLALDILWVEAKYRGQGLGSGLLRAIEEEARRHGAAGATLDTFTFQAEGFYLRHGYVEEARLRDFAGGHDRIYLTKRSL